MSPVSQRPSDRGLLFFERNSVKEFQGHADQKYGHTTYSQHGEDLLIVDIFNQLGIKNPTYLDIGAFDPYDISNTALLYSLGSTGITVDANPYCVNKFENARPHGTHLQFGVIPEGDNIRKYIMFDQQSGRNTLSKEEAIDYSSSNNHPISHEIDVPNISLNELVFKYMNYEFPHFLSIDVEGLDYDILKHAEFIHTMPIVVCVETRLKDSLKMSEMMQRHGYKTYVRMGENIIFLDSKHHANLKLFAGIV